MKNTLQAGHQARHGIVGPKIGQEWNSRGWHDKKWWDIKFFFEKKEATIADSRSISRQEIVGIGEKLDFDVQVDLCSGSIPARAHACAHFFAQGLDD